MLRRILIYTASILFAIFLASGLFLIMMPLSDPTDFEDDIKDILIFGGSLAIIGLGGTFGLRGTYGKLPSFCKVVVGITYVIIICTGILSIGVGLESNVDFESKTNVPFLIAALAFGIVTIVLGFTFLIRIFTNANLDLVTTGKTFFSYLIQKTQRLYLITAIIAVSIGVVIGVGVMDFMKQQYLSDTKVLSEGSRTNATVIEKKIWDYREDPDSYTVKYTFSSPSGELFTGSENMEKQAWDELLVGSPIEIAFNPVDPSQNLPVDGMEKTSPGLAALFLAIFSAVASFVVLLLLFNWIKTHISRLENKPNYLMRK